MAQPTYNVDAVVLKKTKLGESDMIMTMLARDGSQLRAVAKGARKPGGAFAGKLELYNEVSLLCSKGRGLDTIREARLNTARTTLASDIERASCAACVAELAEHLTQPGLEHARLYDLLSASFRALCDGDGAQILYACAASLLKQFAFAGIAPSLSSCAVCESLAMPDDNDRIGFSVRDGGVVCASCVQGSKAYPVDLDVLALASSLMMATFDNILSTDADRSFAMRVLELCRDWNRFHVGSKLRSLDLLIDMGDDVYSRHVQH